MRSYRLDPWTADDDGADRPVGAGIPIDQLASWTPLVTGFIAQTIAGAAVESAASGAVATVRSRLAAWTTGRRRRKALAGALSAPVPPFDEAQRAHFRTLAQLRVNP